MTSTYQHLGEYSNWVEEAKRQSELFPPAKPGPETRRFIRKLMGFEQHQEFPASVTVDRVWEKEGLRGEEISWSVGYGPRTKAWLVKPTEAPGPLPAVLALHDHGGYKFVGKEKIMEGPDEPPRFLRKYWSRYYGGRGWANALAREGFVVLAHDTFLWGSRKFEYETMRAALGDEALQIEKNLRPEEDTPLEVTRYHLLAGQYEHVVSKYCNVLGTTLAGVVSHEDRIALNYLLSRPEVDPERAGCMGLSGGGNRAALLLATAERLKAGAIVGLMSTLEGLLDHNIVTHTWMLFPFLWSRHGDWPDLAGSRAPAPLLVQYDEQDDLFTLEGMREAHQKLQAIYREAGSTDSYTGQFYPGPHKLDLDMQANAFAWLSQVL